MIMKYRWGFLDENDIFSECQPIVDDSTALDFAQESNEIFYRGKINGSLAFRFEFDDILALGYNYEHRIVLQWYDADNDLWNDVWKGRFALTDCEIDFDTKTITVQPETFDRYTKLLDHFEDEYNLVKLAPPMQPVTINIRPCLQIYIGNDTKISNYIGNNYWEAQCEAVTGRDLYDSNFGIKKEYLAFQITYTPTAYYGTAFEYRGGQTISYVGELTYAGGFIRDHTRLYGQYWDGAAWQTDTLKILIGDDGVDYYFQVFGYPELAIDQQTKICTAQYGLYQFGEVARITIDNSSLVSEATSQWDIVCARFLVQTELSSIVIGGNTVTIYDIPNNDILGSNLNYNKYLWADCVEMNFTSDAQDDPTIWGKNYFDKYFVKPTDSGTTRWIPVGQSLWQYFSIWYRIDDESVKNAIDSQLTSLQRINDCYPINHLVIKLLQKAGWSGNYYISGCFGTQDYVGARTFPIITPKSNVISSYYDTPAQNAPITLAKVLTMLKQAYKAYWYIDSNNNIHIEHISFYDNGYQYTEDEPGLLVDLESELHTNTKNNKVFGQNKVKFDKQDMPAQYTFSWMDVQTKAFNGYPIKCLDKYVSKGQKNEINIGDFDTDLDFVLSSPNDVSKEGFFLFALPVVDGNFSTTLIIEKVLVEDEDGQQYEAEIQNADGSFVKIHKTWWRYDLPCEHINVNNEDTTAITTGKYKVQSVEFADSVMADILKDIDNCNKVIRTQQGNGHIKTLSINLNSLVAKGDLLFNFVGRWYYLKGTALGNSIIIFVNGESTTIEVNANKFTYRYKEPIATLKFNAADVVSVNFADCDKLDDLTSCDEMFDGCEELLAVDFGNKTFSAVTSANNMFRGCVALTTLICPDSSTWKADLDLSDCPDLTLASFYDLIKFLYFYNAGVHTITPNTAFWNALDADTQNDLLTKASARSWTIGIPAQYSITGQSAANTVYATINGSPVEISVVGGSWQYDYNTPITSISFENDADMTDIDFSLSDGLAGLTSLNDAFKNCAGLTTVDFTNCDLSNVASASDAFAGCIALYELIIPQDTWQPDLDLSDSVMPKAEMLNVINGLYDYTSGTHTITFNSTIWDAMSVADQQQVFDAADAKGWTTNAVAVIYYIRGTSSAASETFNIQFIQDGSLSPDAVETITVSVDGNGDWEFSYVHKKIFDLSTFSGASSTLLSCDMSNADDLSELRSVYSSLGNSAFGWCNELISVDISGKTMGKLTSIAGMFGYSPKLQSVNLQGSTIKDNISAQGLFDNCSKLTSIQGLSTIISKVTSTYQLFQNCSSLVNADLSTATLENCLSAERMFSGCTSLTSIDLSAATFENCTTIHQMLRSCLSLTSVDMSEATFASVTNIDEAFNTMGTSALSFSLPKATFATVTTAIGSFADAKLQSIDMPLATFTSLTNMVNAFLRCTNLVSVNMPSAILGNVVNASNVRGVFYGCTSLVTLTWSAATLAKIAYTERFFYDCGALTTIDVPQNSTAILPTSTAANAPMDLHFSPLTYTSMLKIANWLSDLTGQTAHTCTFKASAWNALSSAEQTNIDTILSGKNWNRAIA